MADNDGFAGSRVHVGSFLFEVDGLEIGSFQQVSGLQVQIAVEDIEEGGENGFTHHLPGRMSWPNITLKRGVTQTDNLLDWLNKSSGEQFASAGNKLTRSSAALTLMGPGATRLRSWEFVDAFAVKWTGPDFASTAAEMASEQLEIAHHGFKSKTP
ncbi:MAG TPA: phage tail protein [Ilumatobacteraceae bacterium]|jgi:phage tail-like protein